MKGTLTLSSRKVLLGSLSLQATSTHFPQHSPSLITYRWPCSHGDEREGMLSWWCRTLVFLWVRAYWRTWTHQRARCVTLNCFAMHKVFVGHWIFLRGAGTVLTGVDDCWHSNLKDRRKINLSSNRFHGMHGQSGNHRWEPLLLLKRKCGWDAELSSNIKLFAFMPCKKAPVRRKLNKHYKREK